MTSGSWDRVPARGTGFPLPRPPESLGLARCRTSRSSLRHKHKEAVTSRDLQGRAAPRAGNGPNVSATRTTRDDAPPRPPPPRGERGDRRTQAGPPTATPRRAGAQRAARGRWEAPPSGDRPGELHPQAATVKTRPDPGRRRRGQLGSAVRGRRGRGDAAPAPPTAAGARTDRDSPTGTRSRRGTRRREHADGSADRRGRAPTGNSGKSSLAGRRTDGRTVCPETAATERGSLTGQRPARAPTPRAGAEDRRTRTARRLTWPRSKHRPRDSTALRPLPRVPCRPRRTLRCGRQRPVRAQPRAGGGGRVTWRSETVTAAVTVTGRGAIQLDCRPPRTAPPIPEGSALTWK